MQGARRGRDEWKGDTTLDYAKLHLPLPGEAEAKGLPAEEKSGGWGVGQRDPAKSALPARGLEREEVQP
ncbi:MAG: hypothetical protein ACLSVD_11775 [Eggerthellaceae bacterium]